MTDGTVCNLSIKELFLEKQSQALPTWSDSPAELGLKDLQEPQRMVITKCRWLASEGFDINQLWKTITGLLVIRTHDLLIMRMNLYR